MDSDGAKEEIVDAVLQSCTSWATADERRKIEMAVVLALRNYHIEKTETALSMVFEKPNEWYLNQFLAIKSVKGLSEKTLTYYRGTIKQLLEIVPKPIAEITTNDIRYYLATRELRDKVTKVTLANELRNLRSFFTTLDAEDLIPRNPVSKIDAVKTEKKVKKPFTEIEMEQIRRACSAFRLSKKYLAIVEVLYSTGCRVGELVGIELDDIKDDRILVTGKGNKQRWVYLNPRAKVALDDYLSTRKSVSNVLFPNKQGGQMGESGVEGIIRKLGEAAGVEDCHPHRFRRTAATTALRRGMPIEQVSKMLGHEQISTTQIYAITEDEQVQENHRKYLT